MFWREAAPRFAALLDEHARTGTPLPGEMIKGRTCAAVSYLAGTTGASNTQAGNALRRARLPAGSTAPLGTPVTGQLRGKPWTGPISYHQAPALALRLSAACLIVVAYLSGLRPAEILHLQPGCCPAPDGNGTGPVRYRLHGVKFKAARNDDGTPAPDGETRQWTVIPPVHTAIGILEQLTATSQLFPLQPHWLNGAPRPPRRRPEAFRYQAKPDVTSMTRSLQDHPNAVAGRRCRNTAEPSGELSFPGIRASSDGEEGRPAGLGGEPGQGGGAVLCTHAALEGDRVVPAGAEGVGDCLQVAGPVGKDQAVG